MEAGEDEERHASWLELFFDLVFVVVIAQLARQLVDDQALGGFCDLRRAVRARLHLVAGVHVLRGPVRHRRRRVPRRDARGDAGDAVLAILIPDVANGVHTAGFVIAYVMLRR